MKKENLTAEQSRVLNLESGVVIAGAGAGKTRTMIAKIVADQESGTMPEKQIVVTFTNAASLEMQARLVNQGGKTPRRIGTLHSLAMRSIMQSWGGKIEVMNDRQYDDLIRSALKRFKMASTPLSNARGWILDRPQAGNAKLVRKAILTQMRDQRLIHPDAMLAFYLETLEAAPPGISLYVDEAQDGSAADFEIYRRLTSNGGRVIYFGDPRQSIYGFRGASMETFLVEIAERETITLTENFRSGHVIVEAANRIADMMRLMVDPMKAAGKFASEWHHRGGFDTTEAEVADLQNDLIRALSGGESVAILTRYNATLDGIESALRWAGIPYERRDKSAKPTGRWVENLRNLTTDEIPSGSWLATLTRARVPFEFQDHLAKMLTGVVSPFEIGPIIDEMTGKEPDRNAVWLSTIHGAKGLEWDEVHIIGADSQSFGKNKPEDIRLAYVAVTRAKTRVSVSFARSRRSFAMLDGLHPSSVFP